MAFWAQNLDNTSPDHFVTENFESGDNFEVQQGLVTAMSQVRHVGKKVYENQDGSSYAFLKDSDGCDTEWLLVVTPAELDVAERASPVRCYVVKETSDRGRSRKTEASGGAAEFGRFSEKFIASLRLFVGSTLGRTLGESQFAALDAVVQTLDALTRRERRSRFFIILMTATILLSMISLIAIYWVCSDER